MSTTKTETVTLSGSGARAAPTRQLDATSARWVGIVRSPALIIGVLGVIISVAGSWVPSLWYDEAATVTSARRTWAQLWAELHNVDAVHGLYYALMHLWFDIVGYTPFTLRFPSALAIGAAAALLVTLAGRIGGRRLGVVAGLVFILLPRTSWAGTEGRPYATITLLSVGLTLVGVHAALATRRSTTRVWPWWVGYGALAALAVTFNEYLALLVVAHGVAAAWIALAERSAHSRDQADRAGAGIGTFGSVPPPLVTRRSIIGWVLASAAAAVAVSPLVVATIRQSEQVHWIGGVSWRTLQQVFATAWFGSWIPVAFVGWALIILGIVSTFLPVSRTPTIRSSARAQAARIAVPAALAPSLILIAATAAGEHLYTPKYATLSLPFVAILIALALTWIPMRPIRIAAIVLLIALCVPTAVAARAPHAKQNTYWADTASLVSRERNAMPEANEGVVYGAVVHHPRTTAQVIADAYPRAFSGMTDLTQTKNGPEHGELWSKEGNPAVTIPARIGSIDTVWFIGSTKPERNILPTTARTLAKQGFTAARSWTLGTVRISQFRR